MDSIFKFKKVQCFGHACDYVLIQNAGRHICFTGLSDQGIIGQLTVFCSDSENLGIKFQVRPVRPLDFTSHTVTINFEAKLLYPDVAFGCCGKDGVVYERIDFEEILIRVYVDGADLVREMQNDYNAGGELEDLNYEPSEWEDVENIASYFVDEVIR